MNITHSTCLRFRCELKFSIKMIYFELNIKNWIKNFKHKLIELFLFENSIKTLSNTMKNGFVISIGFDEIYNGIKNPKRFKLCIILCLIMWFATFWHILLLTPPIWSLVSGPFLPDHFKTSIFVANVTFLLAAVEKIDYPLAEKNGNLDMLKILHILISHKDSKSHKLNEKNYKKLALLSQIVITLIEYYGVSILSILVNSVIFLVAYLSYQNCGQFYWLIHSIVMSLPYVIMFITILSTGCILFILFIYYKMRFDQLNDKIILIIANRIGKRISIEKEKSIYRLINEHNLLSIEIHKVNLFYRRTAATFFLFSSFVKITIVYVTIYSHHTLLKILIANAFVLCFIFAFALSTSFSLQINSAKSSYKIIHSLVCTGKMRLQLKLKVNQIKVISNSINWKLFFS